MSPVAAVTRTRPLRALRDPRPLSTRGGWHRLSMLATFAVLLVFPWVTSTGCEGKDPPQTFSGLDLLASSIHEDAVWILAPAALVLSALLGISAGRIARQPLRLFTQLFGLVAGLAGAFFTFVALAVPTAADVEEHHAASALGIAVLLAFALDALLRAGLGAREWWIGRRRPAS